MSNSPLNDDDTLMAFKAKGDGRQRAIPVTWKALKAAITALVPGGTDYGPAITAEQKARAAGDGALSDGIAAEAQKRAAGDQANADAVAAETKARGAADQALSDAVTAEALARNNGDAAGTKALADAISAEAKTRGDADTAEAKARADAVSAEAKARGDGDTALGARVKALEDKPPLRLERYSGAVVGTGGVATITWTKAFAAAPLGKVIDGWNGNQQITGRVTATTTTTATVAVRRSKGTLLLTDGPYEVAPAGTTIEIEVSGF